VVFDACRNTLRLTRPGSRAVVQSKGFVPERQENGMLIAYATSEGELASDVGAGAGPYARVLAEEIVKPGIEAVVMFRAVQRRVRAAIKQEPYLGFSALGDVYLAGAEPPKQSPVVAASPAQPQLSESAEVGRDEGHDQHRRARCIHRPLQKHILCRARASAGGGTEEAAGCRRNAVFAGFHLSHNFYLRP
jgi:hypothetical protein